MRSAPAIAAHEMVEIAPPPAAPVKDAPPSDRPPPPAAPAVPAVPPPAAAADPEMVETLPRPQLEASARSGRPVRVGVFGDSFGDGVWSGLYRLLPARDGFQVVKFSQQSTGFTRYRRLNLEQHDDSQIGADPIDVAVISFGANDAQGVCGDDGHCGTLMSARWQAVISARVEAYVAMLRRHGAAVYWVGLPAMRDKAFDGDAVALNSFYRALMAKLGVPFVDIRSLTTDSGGRYEAYYADGDGTQKLLRANDGVHMSMNGYIRITKTLAMRIREGVGDARIVPQQAASDGLQGPR